MKNSFPKLMLFAICLSPIAANAFTISGKVTHEYQDTPIIGTRVDIFNERKMPMINFYAVTADDGSYSIKDLPSGNYFVHAGGAIGNYMERKQLFNEAFYPNSPNIDDAQPITVNEDIPNINFKLTGHYILGSVTETGTGNPLPGRVIRLYNQNWEEISNFLSNEIGVYYFSCLPAGKYYVGTSGHPYMPQFYNLVSAMENATVLDLANAVGFSDINFIPNSGFSIKGKVTDTQANPIANTSVVLLNKAEMDWWNFSVADRDDYTDKNGNYSISGIASGTYYLAANGKVIVSQDPYIEDQIYSLVFYNNVLNPDLASPITVNGFLTDYNFVLSSGLTISGKVLNDKNDKPVVSDIMYLYSPNGDYLNMKISDNLGKFSFDGLSQGDYVVYSSGELESNPGEPIYQPLYYENSTDIKDATVIRLNDDFTDIVMRLKQIPGTNPGSTEILNNRKVDIFNYPNPFSTETTLFYTLRKAGNVKIKVFNLYGQFILTIVNGYQNSGKHEEHFSAENIPSGIYFYQLEVDTYPDRLRKFICLK
jgi:hypothetical protein